MQMQRCSTLVTCEGVKQEGALGGGEWLPCGKDLAQN